MEPVEKMKSKAGVSNVLWERIKEHLESKKITQTQLAALCCERGFRIKQPEISKLYSGRVSLSLYQAVAFSEVLGISIDQLLYKRNNSQMLHLKETSFIINPEDEAFAGYLGSYWTIFHSTSTFENKVLYGKMAFRPSGNGEFCEALFELDTGEKDIAGKAIVKIYRGQLVLSRKLQCATCILINEKLAEITMLEFRHRSFLIKQAECRLGLVLTVSAGEVKVPVAQKIFLSRYKINKGLTEELEPFLKMGTDEVLITKEKLKELPKRADGDKKYEISQMLDIGEHEEFFRLNEGTLRKLYKRLNRHEVAEIFSVLKEISEEPFLLSVDEWEDSAVYDILKNVRDKNHI